MQAWCHHPTVSVAAMEAMTALQLDYRFEVDGFDARWWPVAKHRGWFVDKRNGPPVDRYAVVMHHHHTPAEKEEEDHNDEEKKEVQVIRLYDVTSLCHKLNALAIPQGRSVLDRLGCGEDFLCTHNDNRDEVETWATIRDDLLWQKFHKEIEQHYAALPKKQLPSTKNGTTPATEEGTSNTVTTTRIKRSSASTRIKKKPPRTREAKRAKTNSATEESTVTSTDAVCTLTDSTAPSEFVSLCDADYQEVARHHPLTAVAAKNEDDVCVGAFENWNFLLSTNHALLVYGVGSKRTLLRRFAHDCLDGDVVEVEGFRHDATIESLLQLLREEWLGEEKSSVGQHPHGNTFHVHYEKGHPRTSSRQCAAQFRIPPFFPHHRDLQTVQHAVSVAHRLSKIVMRTARPITLLIHNMEGPGFGTTRAHEVLAALVSASRTECGVHAIRVLASVDHINGQELLWTTSARHRLQWCWHEVHTQRPYTDEVVGHPEHSTATTTKNYPSGKRNTTRNRKKTRHYDDDDDNENNGPQHQHDAIFSVLKSLASTHAESLRQLAWLQLEKAPEDDDDDGWVSYKTLLQRCRSERIVQADHQLRLYLGELLDHDILERNEKQRSTSAATSYRIPYPNTVLQLIWDYTAAD